MRLFFFSYTTGYAGTLLSKKAPVGKKTNQNGRGTHDQTFFVADGVLDVVQRVQREQGGRLRRLVDRKSLTH